MIKSSSNETGARKRFTKEEVLDKSRSGALERANLRGINLSFESMADSKLAGSNLVRAKLRGTSLKNADLTSADLRGADLAHADLTQARLTGADLRNAKLCGAVFTKTDARSADFGGADLAKARIVDSDFSDAYFHHANALRCRMESSDFTGADFDGADLSESRITACEMSRADLTETAFLAAQLDRVNLVSVRARKARFGLSRIDNSSFAGADIARANFSAASFSQVDFSRANVRGAGFRSAKGLSKEEIEELTAQGAGFRSWWPVGLLNKFRKKRRFLKFGILLAICAMIVGLRYHWIFNAVETNEPVATSNQFKLYKAKSAVDDADFTILCAVDSQTSGRGAPARMDYPAQLEALLNKSVSGRRFKVINAGRATDDSGRSATRLIKRLNKDGDSIDLVVFNSGINNARIKAYTGLLPENIHEKLFKLFPSFISDTTPGNASGDNALNITSATELDRLIRDLKKDLERVYKATASKNIKLVVLDYYYPVMWVDVAYSSFSLETGVPLVSIANFGMESMSAAGQLIKLHCRSDKFGKARIGSQASEKPRPEQCRYLPNEYGNARIAEILYQTFLEQRLIQTP